MNSSSDINRYSNSRNWSNHVKWTCLYPLNATSPLIAESQSEDDQAVSCNNTERNGDWFAQPQRTRHAGACKHGRREQSDLFGIRLIIAESSPAQQIQCANGKTGRNRWNGACACVADDAAEGGQGGKGSGGGDGEV